MILNHVGMRLRVVDGSACDLDNWSCGDGEGDDGGVGAPLATGGAGRVLASFLLEEVNPFSAPERVRERHQIVRRNQCLRI